MICTFIPYVVLLSDTAAISTQKSSITALAIGA